MSPSSCPTSCESYQALVQDQDQLRLYKFIKRLRLEFESFCAQLQHHVSLPSQDDALASVADKETRLRAMTDSHTVAPHSILTTPHYQGASTPLHLRVLHHLLLMSAFEEEAMPDNMPSTSVEATMVAATCWCCSRAILYRDYSHYLNDYFEAVFSARTHLS